MWPFGKSTQARVEDEMKKYGFLAGLPITVTERGGTVYFGYRNAANITRSTVRLNLPAANAVLGTLGIAAITP